MSFVACLGDRCVFRITFLGLFLARAMFFQMPLAFLRGLSWGLVSIFWALGLHD